MPPPPSSRKRQARLTFSPLPTSSPAAASYPQQVRERAAAVGYDGSPGPAKRRKLQDISHSPLKTSIAQNHGTTDKSILPTPDPSAATKAVVSANNLEDSDSEPVRASQPTLKQLKRKRDSQKRLDFALSSPSPIKPASINMSQPVRASTQKPGIFGTQKQIVIDDDSSEGSASVDELSPPQSHEKETHHLRRKTHDTPHSLSPANLRSSRSSQKTMKHTSERRGSAEDRFQDFGEHDEESDDLPTTPAISRRKAGKSKSTTARHSSPFIVEDDEESDELQVLSSRRRRSPKKRARNQESDQNRGSDEDNELPSSSRKRLLRKGKGAKAKSSNLSTEELQELQDEVQDLASSGDSNASDDEVQVRSSQRNRSSQKSIREQALERLKRRRAGTLPIVEEEDDGEDEVDEEEDVVNEDELADDDVNDVPFSSTKDMFTRDENDEGFITEDEDGPLGVPQGVPLVFTRFASMKAKELFKYAVEWMVQKKINPAFQMDDEIYDLAFKKLDDEVKGLASSKFASSAWTQDFSFALRARPQIAYAPIDRKSANHFTRDKCDACNRSGHPATYEIQFQGKPYHHATLEDVADEDEDSDSDDSSSEPQERGPDRDSKGRVIPSEDAIFYVGKFCMANAETAHALEHWRYHLYEWVVDWLQTTGYNTPEMIVQRDKWSTRKRRKFANKIVDAMEKQDKIKALYRDFKTELDTARSSKQGRWNSSP